MHTTFKIDRWLKLQGLDALLKEDAEKSLGFLKFEILKIFQVHQNIEFW